MKILVVGDIMLDEYVGGTSDRISPEAPVPIVKVKERAFNLGGAANVALGVVKFGADASIISSVGCDNDASILVNLLEKGGVIPNLNHDAKLRTVKKTRIHVKGHQLLRLDEEQNDPNIGRSVFDIVKSVIKDYQTIILSDYNKGNLTHSIKIIKLATSIGITCIVDPKIKDWKSYFGCDLITPNSTEFEATCQFEGFKGSMEDCAIRLMSLYSIKAILVTLGAEGMKLFRPGCTPYRIKSEAREVFDVTGAGDTVIAVLATCLTKGFEVEKAMLFSNYAAGITVSKFGTYAVTLAEVLEVLRRHPLDEFKAKIISSNELEHSLSELRNDKKIKVVFTNGCFDILHSGHIRYLSDCKSFGDLLVVGVNSDQSVARLKGPKRPINSIENRCELLSALAIVDYITVFDTDTPELLISQIIPDVLVKGGDYKPDEIVGSDFVKRNGGEIHCVPYHKNHSTSKIIKKIQFGQ